MFAMGIEQLDYLKKALDRRSFNGLMDLYEQIYHLLGTLIPQLDVMPVRTESKVAEFPTLFLTIEERCKYTTTVSMTYYFDTSDGERIADPDLKVRIYHDAKQAEALLCRNIKFTMQRSSGVLKSPAVDCRWESNLFLEKWLNYSLEQGHQFMPHNVVTPVSKEVETALEPS